MPTNKQYMGVLSRSVARGVSRLNAIPHIGRTGTMALVLFLIAAVPVGTTTVGIGVPFDSPKRQLTGDDALYAYWAAVTDAIIEVESQGDEQAVCGRYVGAMQIAPVMVRECNNILKKQGKAPRFTLADRYSAEKSRQMFVVYQSYYNPTGNIERAIRLWNGGNNYNRRATQRYYDKVMAAMCR